MTSIYQEVILEHYRNPRNLITADEVPEGIEPVANPLCGDEMQVVVDHDGTTIQSIRFAARGCAISIASASMLSQELEGMTIDELRSYGSDQVRALLGIELSPIRIKCALLPLEAIKRAVFLSKT